MSFEEFKASLEAPKPPEVSPELQALWHARKGNWERAHEIAQEIHTPPGSWIHAHLHREEGDLSNASYWYSLAGKPVSKSELSQEWDEIVRALI
jgi:hypothetical protein